MGVTKRQLAVATLLGNPCLSHKDIAAILHITPGTVAQHAHIIKRKLKGQLDNAEIESYRAQLRERMPAEKRVRTLEKAMDKVGSNPFVALKAVEMVDERLGLAPKHQDSAPEPTEHKPMFILPAGAHVQVNILQKVDRRQIGGDKNDES